MIIQAVKRKCWTDRHAEFLWDQFRWFARLVGILCDYWMSEWAGNLLADVMLRYCWQYVLTQPEREDALKEWEEA